MRTAAGILPIPRRCLQAGWENLAADSNFSIDYLTHTDSINDEFLSHFQLVIQLDFTPYGWEVPRRRGSGVSTLYRRVVEVALGSASITLPSLVSSSTASPCGPGFTRSWVISAGKSSISPVLQRRWSASKTIGDHPVFRGIPDSFVVQKEEWYVTAIKAPPECTCSARVDESTYEPDTDRKNG